MIAFASKQLSEQQPRDDYKEPLELNNLVRWYSSTGIKFKKPGAFHRAHWMVKLIFSIQIFTFKKQFKIIAKQEKGQQKFVIFLFQFISNTGSQLPVLQVLHVMIYPD